jgi:hypothetical protein
VNAAKSFWVVRGMILAIRYGSKTIVGCEPCVQRLGRQELLTNLVAGWWSLIGIAATPFAALQNLAVLATPSSTSDIETALARAGIDADAVRVDARGFTGEQRRMLDAAYVVLGRAVMANSRITSRKLDVAVRIISQITGQRIPVQEISDAILLADADAVHPRSLPREYRALLLRMAADVVGGDGPVDVAEISFLECIAQSLGFADSVVAELFAELRGTRSSGEHGTQADDQLLRALACLGVSDPMDLDSIKAAYRRLMLRYHPDHAGAGKHDRAASNKKAQELNWAYHFLLEYPRTR